MLGRLLSGKAIGTDELVVRDTKFLDADENIDWEKWAPNGGRVPGTIKENQTIPAGTIIDRYGSQWGKYTSPAGVPYEQRALPYIENPNAYHKYEVLKIKIMIVVRLFYVLQQFFSFYSFFCFC